MIPFRNNAFGDGSSYALALLAGSAVAVVGPYLTMTTSGLAGRVFEALFENGWSTGEIAAALGCVDDNTSGFAPYIVLGSPDFQLVPRPVKAADLPRDGVLRVCPEGRDTVAVDLPPQPPALREVVADDGDEAWGKALARRVEAPGRAALVVAFDGPQRFVGTLRLDDARKARAALADRCDELDRRLGVLVGYDFAAPEASLAGAVRALVRETALTVRAPYLLRAATAGALRWARAIEALRKLEESVALRFVTAVVERDVSFDRESENGFVPGPLRRTDERCHVCGGTLYVGIDRWAADEDYTRLKATCPNCFAVAMRLTSSSLASVGIAHAREGAVFSVRLTLRPGVERPLRAIVAAAPRRGPREHAVGPIVVDVADRREACVGLGFPSSSRGVVTYRILVLCEGAAELYTAVDPGAPSSAATCAKPVTVVGSAAGPGQGRLDGLNQTGKSRRPPRRRRRRTDCHRCGSRAAPGRPPVRAPDGTAARQACSTPPRST